MEMHTFSIYVQRHINRKLESIYIILIRIRTKFESFVCRGNTFHSRLSKVLAHVFEQKYYSYFTGNWLIVSEICSLNTNAFSQISKLVKEYDFIRNERHPGASCSFLEERNILCGDVSSSGTKCPIFQETAGSFREVFTVPKLPPSCSIVHKKEKVISYSNCSNTKIATTILFSIRRSSEIELPAKIGKAQELLSPYSEILCDDKKFIKLFPYVLMLPFVLQTSICWTTSQF